MGEINLHEISFRGVNPLDMALLEKWYSMTDQLGYATGFKTFDEVQKKIMPAHGEYSMVSMMIIHGDDQAAGFVCCELWDLNGKNMVWIHIIIVDPAFQNRGIGTWAVRKLLHCFQCRGATAVMASVSEDNKGGLRFWERLGFARASAMEKSLSASGTSGVAIMKKSLAGNQAG